MTQAGGASLDADTSAILAAADWMSTSASDMHGDLQTLIKEVRSLLSHWKGTAADSHSDAWHDWFADANNLMGGLEQDAAALRAVVTGYVDTDSAFAAGLADSVLDLP